MAETPNVSHPEVLSIEDSSDMWLRLASKDDMPELYEVMSNNREHLERHLQIGNLTPQEVSRNTEWILQKMQEGSYLQYRIINNDKIVGSVTLYDLGAWEGVAKFGCWVAKEAEGQGFASAASRQLVRYGFDELGLSRVLFEINPENVRSEQLAQHAGATLMSDVITETEEDGRELTYRVWEINQRP